MKRKKLKQASTTQKNNEICWKIEKIKEKQIKFKKTKER